MANANKKTPLYLGKPVTILAEAGGRASIRLGDGSLKTVKVEMLRYADEDRVDWWVKGNRFYIRNDKPGSRVDVSVVTVPVKMVKTLMEAMTKFYNSASK